LGSQYKAACQEAALRFLLSDRRLHLFRSGCGERASATAWVYDGVCVGYALASHRHFDHFPRGTHWADQLLERCA